MHLKIVTHEKVVYDDNVEEIYSKVKKGKIPSTLHIEWMEYKKDNDNGYQYTQFCKLFNDYVKQASLY